MKIKILYVVFALILLNSCAPLSRLANFAPSKKIKPISFSEETTNKDYKFFFSDTLNHQYLRDLRKNYELDKATASAGSELEKIKIVLNWASSQWQHNGSNTPSNPDALTILEEAKNGAQFRCVEYGILASSCLNSLGIPARVLGLKTRDVEKVRFGAGHVVTEVFSNDLEKWIFIDPQFNLMPTLKNVPLNAVEFQDAIVNKKDHIVMVNVNGNASSDLAKSYIDWIGKYLFYFDVLFDQRIGNEPDYKNINGKTKLMLVPLGEKEPTIFQRHSPINYSFYTHSIKDFYRKPY